MWSVDAALILELKNNMSDKQIILWPVNNSVFILYPFEVIKNDRLRLLSGMIPITSKFNKNLSISFLVITRIYFDFLYFYVVCV